MLIPLPIFFILIIHGNIPVFTKKYDVGLTEQNSKICKSTFLAVAAWVTSQIYSCLSAAFNRLLLALHNGSIKFWMDFCEIVGIHD